jgi:predicted ATP-grasp superfamily ATP-dependent carboligase
VKNKPGVVIIEGHVQGLANTRAIGNEGIPVIVVDKHNCIARYSKFCQGYFRSPDFQTDDFAHFLIDLAKKEKLDGWSLIPSNDHAVYTIARFRDQLSAHYKIITPYLPVIENIYKKSRLLALADKIGIPIPTTWYPENKENLESIQFHFPLMIKGREGLTFYKTTGRKVFIAENMVELIQVFEQLPKEIKITDTFIQEIIPTKNVVKYLNGSDVFISTAFMEGSSNVIKEAMACNCPVVSTNAGDAAWVIGETPGCYITTFDPEGCRYQTKTGTGICQKRRQNQRPRTHHGTGTGLRDGSN